MSGVREVEDDKVIQPLKPVIRIANERDLEQAANNKVKEKDAFRICQEKIRKHELEMKLIDAEYTFDNNKVLFYFTADGTSGLPHITIAAVASYSLRHNCYFNITACKLPLLYSDTAESACIVRQPQPLSCIVSIRRRGKFIFLTLLILK